MGMRGIPPPPPPVRRVVRVLWPLVGLALSAVLAPLVLLGAFLVPVDRRARLFRVSWLLLVALWVDIRMLLACWALWLRSPDGSSPTWRADHERLLTQSLDQLMFSARRWVGFDVVLTDRMHFGRDNHPLVALSRHAGPADSLAVAWLLSRTASRLPRIVLAEALRWDPSVDIILSRLEAAFVPADSGAADQRLAGVASMAASLAPNDVFLIFPEGENWSPGRRAGLIAKLRQRGHHDRASRAEQLRYTLPPRSRGAWAARSAAPEADVMVIAHAGFGLLTSPREVWDALPFSDRPFRVRTWTYDADAVPRDADEFADWLDDRWREVDEWVAAHAVPAGWDAARAARDDSPR
jgi:1-acyl-sn-glycerol-3-phosphate acyltransferase